MASNPISFRVSNPDVLAALDSIGKALDRDRSYMINNMSFWHSCINVANIHSFFFLESVHI